MFYDSRLRKLKRIPKDICFSRQCSKLDTLLDAHLEKTITGEEYTAKKNKILARKIDIEQKLKDFERKGNRWLERTRNFILAAHQANSVALGDNFSEKKNYLEKVGLYHTLKREEEWMVK